MHIHMQETANLFQRDIGTAGGAQSTWEQMADGPVGATVSYFVLQSLNGNGGQSLSGNGLLWLHGGIDPTGAVKSQLWSVQFFRREAPLWTMQTADGPDRMQHCSCSVDQYVYIWGGKTGTTTWISLFVCVCVTGCSLSPALWTSMSVFGKIT